MKKLICIMAVFVVVAFAGAAFAVQSVTWTSKRFMVPGGGSEWIEVKAVYTCAADASFTTTAFYEDEVAEAASKALDLRGFYLYQIVHDVGATGVTDNTDLSVLDAATGYDLLSGAGTNFMDNADATPLANTKPWINGSESAVPIYTPAIYLKIENNAVNDATGTLIFKFIR